MLTSCWDCRRTRTSEYDAACASLLNALEISPEFEQAYADLCRVRALAGNAKGAKDAIDAGIARFPNNASFHHYLGNLQMTAADPAAALESYSRELVLSPNDAQAHLNVGLALSGLKKFGEASESFQRAVEIDPASAAAHVNLGRSLKAEGRLTEAAASLRRVARLAARRCADTLNALGSVLQAQGRTAGGGGRSLRTRRSSSGPTCRVATPTSGLAWSTSSATSHEAVSHLSAQACLIKPIAEMHDNLGIALQKRGAGRTKPSWSTSKRPSSCAPDNPSTRTATSAVSAVPKAASPRVAIAAYRLILWRCSIRNTWSRTATCCST